MVALLHVGEGGAQGIQLILPVAVPVALIPRESCLGLKTPLNIADTVLDDLIVAPLGDVLLGRPRVLIQILLRSGGLEGLIFILTLGVLKSERKVGLPEVGSFA